MEKRDAASMRARHRRLVDQAIPFRFQSREMRLDVVDAEADVMDPFAAFLDELRDRRVGAGRLEELEVGVADGEEGRFHFLRLDRFGVLDRQAEGLVDLRRVERLHRDADVIELGHQTPVTSGPQMCLCNCVWKRAGTWSASNFMSIVPQTGEKSTVQRWRRFSSTTRFAHS